MSNYRYSGSKYADIINHNDGGSCRLLHQIQPIFCLDNGEGTMFYNHSLRIKKYGEEDATKE